jgi:hypothetical protein
LRDVDTVFLLGTCMRTPESRRTAGFHHTEVFGWAARTVSRAGLAQLGVTRCRRRLEDISRAVRTASRAALFHVAHAGRGPADGRRG